MVGNHELLSQSRSGQGLWEEECVRGVVGWALAELGSLHPCSLKSFSGPVWPPARGSCQGSRGGHPSSWCLPSSNCPSCMGTSNLECLRGPGQIGGLRHCSGGQGWLAPAHVPSEKWAHSGLQGSSCSEGLGPASALCLGKRGTGGGSRVLPAQGNSAAEGKGFAQSYSTGP